MTRSERLAEIEGCNLIELLEEATADSVAPAICENCDYTDTLEPDGTMTCPDCGGKVKSILLWEGLI